jgi:hypothetical protein
MMAGLAVVVAFVAVRWLGNEVSAMLVIAANAL